MAQQPHVADELERFIYRAHDLVFDLREQPRDHREVERRIDEGREIGAGIGDLFRARLRG